MTTPLTALDAAFLEMESSATPMHVGAVCHFEGAPLLDGHGRLRLADLRAIVEERVGLFPRFRQRLATVPLGLGRPRWVDDGDFDVAFHVNATTLPSPGSPEQLHHLVEHLQTQRLDRSRPLWELWFVDGLADGTVALVEKIHHALVDGVSGVDIAMMLMDDSPERRTVTTPPWEPDLPPPPWLLLAGAIADTLTEPVRAAVGLIGWAVRPGAAGRRAGAVLRGLPSLLRTGRAPASTLNRPVSRTRRFAVVRTSLPDIKATGAVLDSTVNDVVLAAVAGGLRHLLLDRGSPLADRPLHALVPVSLRSDDARYTLGNRVSAMIAPLPVHEPDARTRLALVHRALAEAKASGEATATAALLDGGEHLPEPLVAAVARLVHHQPLVNVVVTNVPGPPLPLYLLGARMLDCAPVVPLGGNLDVSVGVLSYDGRLTLGLLADAATCSDVAVLADGVLTAFAELADAARRCQRAAPPTANPMVASPATTSRKKWLAVASTATDVTVR